jgi:hypothetical protein
MEEIYLIPMPLLPKDSNITALVDWQRGSNPD